jgi:hypothetical protein
MSKRPKNARQSRFAVDCACFSTAFPSPNRQNTNLSSEFRSIGRRLLCLKTFAPLLLCAFALNSFADSFSVFPHHVSRFTFHVSHSPIRVHPSRKAGSVVKIHGFSPSTPEKIITFNNF